MKPLQTFLGISSNDLIIFFHLLPIRGAFLKSFHVINGIDKWLNHVLSKKIRIIFKNSMKLSNFEEACNAQFGRRALRSVFNVRWIQIAILF